MRILITGVNGFIGSHCYKILSKSHEVFGVDRNLDGRRLYGEKVNFIHRDLMINCTGLLDNIDVVIHFAAETFVDYSILHPHEFINSNILGTYNLLEESRKVKLKRFIHISTDEVYGACLEGYFSEDSPLWPGNPYSATKASADMLCISYKNTFDIPITILRPENNYGTFQGKEKFIPTIIKNILEGIPVPIYGDGKHVRQWLHVEDMCSAVKMLVESNYCGPIYNIGSKQEKENIQIFNIIKECLGLDFKIKYIEDSKARPGHDRRYGINTHRIESTGWQAKHRLEDSLPLVVNWYKNNKDWLK